MDFANCSNATVWRPEARSALAVEGRHLGWNVAPEHLPSIPVHWLQGYPEPDPLLNYGLGLLYCFFFFFACLGNGVVIWIFMTAKSLRTPSNMLVVNLAVCDFIMMAKTPIFIWNSFNLGYELGPLGCQIFAFAGSISGIGAATTNAAIAYDRYTTIAKPFDGKVTRGKAFLILFLIWAYVTPWSILPLMQIWGRFVPEGFLTSCTFDYLTDSENIRIFTAVMFTVCYVIPMSLVIYFYYQIVGRVFQHEKTLRDQAKRMNVESLRSGQANQQSAEIRIAKTAIMLCFLFVLSWTPYGVLALIGAFGNKSLLTPGVTMIPACTCKLVACIDPYVYAISHPRYRLELQKRMPFLAIKEPQPVTETASTTTEATSA